MELEFISIFYLLDIIFLTILDCKHVGPILLQYVAQTIILIDNYCKTEFRKIEQNKKSRKHLRNYGKFGQDLLVILREIRPAILNDQPKVCKH